MTDSDRNTYAKCCEVAGSSVAAYALTKDKAYGFRAYRAWRVAVSMQEAAFAAIRDEQIRLSTGAGNPPNLPAVEASLEALKKSLRLIQEAVLRVLDEIAVLNFEPTLAAEVKVNRHNVLMLTLHEAKRLAETGGTQAAVTKAVARKLRFTVGKTRKLLQQRLEDPWAVEQGHQHALDNVFVQLKERLREQRLKRKGSASPAHKRGPHPWRSS